MLLAAESPGTEGDFLAFSGKECGTTGSLGPGWMQTVLFASVSISADGLEPVMAAGGECAIEFTVTSRVSIAGQDFSESERVRVSRRSELDLSFFPEGDDVPPEVGETIVKSVIGSAVASESRSRGRMVAGIGMAGAAVEVIRIMCSGELFPMARQSIADLSGCADPRSAAPAHRGAGRNLLPPRGRRRGDCYH